MTTAEIFAKVNVSTWNTRPTSNVKKPFFLSEVYTSCQNHQHIPLVLDKIVALATLVRPRLALTLQFAMNQKRQKIDANFAVSRVVSGSNSSALRKSSEKIEGARKFAMMVDVGASKESAVASTS